MTVTDSTISGNTSHFYEGGGIDDIDGGCLTVVNSTITGNSAGTGGSVYVSCNTSATICDSTIAGNPSGGIYYDVYAQNFTISESIVGGNSGYDIADSYGSRQAFPFNPHLAPLGWYGGPTETMRRCRSPASGINGSTSNNRLPIMATKQLPLSSTTHPDLGAPKPIRWWSPWIRKIRLVPVCMSVQDAVNLSNLVGGDQPIGFASTALTTTGSALTDPLVVAWPSSVADGSSVALQVSSDSSSQITGWTFAWTDGDGDPLYGDTGPVSGSSGTDTYTDPTTSTLIATITATDESGDTYVLPAITTTIPIDPPTGPRRLRLHRFPQRDRS